MLRKYRRRSCSVHACISKHFCTFLHCMHFWNLVHLIACGTYSVWQSAVFVSVSNLFIRFKSLVSFQMIQIQSQRGQFVCSHLKWQIKFQHHLYSSEIPFNLLTSHFIIRQFIEPRFHHLTTIHLPSEFRADMLACNAQTNTGLITPLSKHVLTKLSWVMQPTSDQSFLEVKLGLL